MSQFHTQDGAGRAVFGYNSADQARVEARSGDGRVRGSYSYRDPTGKVVKASTCYVSVPKRNLQSVRDRYLDHLPRGLAFEKGLR